MKTAISLFSTIVFYILAFSGLLWLSYKIMDLLNVKTDLPEPEKPHEHNTTYPEYPARNFNEWSNYINSQR